MATSATAERGLGYLTSREALNLRRVHYCSWVALESVLPYWLLYSCTASHLHCWRATTPAARPCCGRPFSTGATQQQHGEALLPPACCALCAVCRRVAASKTKCIRALSVRDGWFAGWRRRRAEQERRRIPRLRRFASRWAAQGAGIASLVALQAAHVSCLSWIM